MIDIFRACLVLVLATDIPASDKGDGKPWGDAYISNRYKKIIEKAGITKEIMLLKLVGISEHLCTLGHHAQFLIDIVKVT